MANDLNRADSNAISREDVLKFAIEEYKALRAEIIERSKMDHAIQRNAIVVTGAISSWVFSRNPDPGLAFVLLIIPLVLLIAHFQQARHKAYGIRIGRYIYSVEEWIYSEINKSRNRDALGWEIFLEKERKDEKERHRVEGTKSYFYEIKESLSGKGFSLSATVVDARYLTVGAVIFTVIAAGYFAWAFWLHHPSGM